jgi:hypothetical protein
VRLTPEDSEDRLHLIRILMVDRAKEKFNRNVHEKTKQTYLFQLHIPLSSTLGCFEDLRNTLNYCTYEIAVPMLEASWSQVRGLV